MKKATLITCFLLGLLLANSGCGPKTTPMPPTDLPPQLYKAKILIEDSHPKKAHKLITKWIKKHKDHPDMDRALFLKAQADLDRNRDYQAAESYDKLTKDHSNSRHFTESLEQQVVIAEKFLNGKKRHLMGLLWITAKTDAIEMLDKVIQRWPGSPLAVKALLLQADFFFNEERFVEAQDTYQLVIDHYKTAPQYRYALLQSAEATFRQFNGLRYDATPLIEARIRYAQARPQLPDGTTDADITDRLDDIENLLAQKELDIADYYHRTGQTQQARISWNQVATQWPDSPWGALARKQLSYK